MNTPHNQALLKAYARLNKLSECHRYEESLIKYVEYVWPVVEPAIPFVKGWAIEAIAEHLEAVTDGYIKRLLINVPPGFTKSLMTDVFWPSYEWGPKNLPHLRYVCASYSNHLTERDNMRCRNVVLSDRYRRLWGDRFKISNEQFTKVKFANDKTGWKLATSVGGIGVGERGDRFIIDDANNTMDMESEAIRRNTNMWFTEVVPDRLNNQVESAIVVIQQRLHEDDVSGTAISREMGYTHLMIPMEHDVARHCRTYLGNGKYWEDPRTEEFELAWPERFPVQIVGQLKNDKGQYAYCNTGEAPVLMSDLTMKPIRDVKSGDGVLGFTLGNSVARARTVPARVLSVSVSERPIVKMTLESGAVIRCTPDHKWWTGRKDVSHPSYAPAYAPDAKLPGNRKRGSALKRVCPTELPLISDPEDIRLAGWLSGFFDGEGTVSVPRRREGEASLLIGFSQGDGRNGPICDKLEGTLARFGFNYGLWKKPNQSSGPSATHSIRFYWLKSDAAAAGSARGSRLPLTQRFLHIAKPVKWRDRMIEVTTNGRLFTTEDRVVSIEPDGIETVYGLETTTGNYVVWGIASSNSGQYQQSPEPRGGSILKRDYWKLWESDKYPGFDFILASLDTAYTEKQENDPSALTIWGVFRDEHDNPKVMLIWAWQERLEFHALVQRVADTCTIDPSPKNHPRFPIDRLLIEGTAAGISVSQELYRLFGLSGKFGIELTNPRKYGDKVARVQSIEHLFSSGMVLAPDRNFADMVIDQCAVFPKGSHDDLVDTTSQALRWLRDSGFMPRTEENQIVMDEEMMFRPKMQPLYPV